MEGLDAVAGKAQRLDGGGVASLHRGIDLGRADAQLARGQIEPVELAGRLDQGRVAPRRHVIDDGSGRRLDISGRLALAGQEACELLGKIGAVAVEANGHGGVSGGAS